LKWIRGDTEESGDLARGCRRREIIFQRWGAGFSRKTFWQCFRQACVRMFSSFNVFFLNSSNSVATLKRCGVFVSNSRQKVFLWRCPLPCAFRLRSLHKVCVVRVCSIFSGKFRIKWLFGHVPVRFDCARAKSASLSWAPAFFLGILAPGSCDMLRSISTAQAKRTW
jgi:hypothetical protein